MISKTFEKAFAQVKTLADKFQKDEQHFLSPKYQEAEVRQEFLDNFFVALGWDVYHHEHLNPYEREVKIEKSVMVQGRGKRADYAFFTAPNFAQARFLAEAKKPSRQLENTQDCFQAIRYGWNSNTPLAVLTDFEQFFVLDSRYKPSVETSTNRIIKKFHYTDFSDEEKFREIYFLFSREAVGGNSLENFANSLRKSKGARAAKLFNTAIIQPIDEEFLSELDQQRINLARAFKNRNAELDGEILTEITQRTLDRLVFLRFLEDKLVEPDSVIDNLGKKSGSAWRDFIAEMPRLNQVYNGTLFRPHAILDKPTFAPEKRAFEQTRDWLAHAGSPYDFNSIPIHILGSIYERFLGKTIEATGKRATVVDKPEVRKAGGVYYTPEYIVRYIVENTIGKLIEGKTPDEIAEMRFADIACGSGSFLLGVFDYLIAYHVKYYSENKTRRAQAIKDGLCRETVEGNLQLTINYKREILLNNIYGVDLDAQAVEVAQLSLYLKLLEEETTATKQQFLAGFREQLLPSLNNNIVHGNSLIDYDIMDGMLFDTKDLKKLNPMNFAQTFPEVFQKGGFDAIVGNPPYVRPHNLSMTDKEYFWKTFKCFTHKSDLYSCFMEKSYKLLKNGGYFSYIVSHGWLNLNSFQNLRQFILKNYKVLKLVELPFKVFAQAQVSTGVFVFQKQNSNNGISSEIEIIRGNEQQEFNFLRSISQKTFLSTFENIFDLSISPKTEAVKEKMRKGITIGELFDIKFGLKTGDDKKFLHFTQEFHGEDKKLLRGENVKRYRYEYKGEFVWYVPNKMKEHRKTARPGETERFEQPKVLVKDTSSDFAGTYDDENYYVKDVLVVIPKKDIVSEYNLKYLIAFINSRALHFYYRTTFKTIHVQNGELASLPIPKIDFGNPKEKATHNKMVELVEKMLDAKKSLADAQTDRDKQFYARFCESLDKQIDNLVYDLYEITNEERKIIEG